MRLIDAERLRKELLWKNVFLTDNEIDALVDLIDNQPTIFPLNDPLTLDELRAMVGNPVYDCLGQVWYIVESYYDHDLIMTDGTHFNDENKYAKVSKRFYCNRPTLPVPQWIRVEERLPERNGEYIVTACDEGEPYDEIIWNDTVVVCAEYYKGCWTWEENSTEYSLDGIVTHWMPLPEPPEERYKCR